MHSMKSDDGVVSLCSAPRCTKSLRRFRRGTKYCSALCRKRGQRERQRRVRDQADRRAHEREERARYGLPSVEDATP